MNLPATITVTFAAILAACSVQPQSDTMNTNDPSAFSSSLVAGVPAIDAAAPAEYETATFALG